MARLWSLVVCLGIFGGGALLADDAVPQPAETDKSPVAAVVNGRKIHNSEVEALLESAIPESRRVTLDAPSLALLRAETLAQLIDRRLVEAALIGSSGAPSTKDVDAAIENTRLQLESQHKSLDDLLTQRRLTLAQLRDQFAWQVLWERTVAKYLTDKILQEYFESHRRQYDGSEVRASHILLRPAGRPDATAANALLEEAAALRAQIEAGKLTFAEAAEKYSAGPSREQGGDVGFFSRHGAMAEAFSQAAFALEKGEISPPVVTPFGVHLITVTDVKPGKKSWSDVADELKVPAAKAMFDKLAQRERSKADVEFTDAWPYFKAGTRQVVIPTGAAPPQ